MFRRALPSPGGGQGFESPRLHSRYCSFAGKNASASTPRVLLRTSEEARAPYEPLWVVSGLDVHFGFASGETVFDQLHYRSCDLLAAPFRGFDRVGVIPFFGTDQSQID